MTGSRRKGDDGPRSMSHPHFCCIGLIFMSRRALPSLLHPGRGSICAGNNCQGEGR